VSFEAGQSCGRTAAAVPDASLRICFTTASAWSMAYMARPRPRSQQSPIAKTAGAAARLSGSAGARGPWQDSVATQAAAGAVRGQGRRPASVRLVRGEGRGVSD